MKKYFCLILFLFSAITFAQKFEFDFVREYVTKTPDYDKTTITYSNSKNPNYILMIHHKFPTKSGSLCDFENKKIHVFKVFSRNENGKMIYEFKYKKSRKVKQSYYDHHKYDTYKFDVIKKEGAFTTLLFTHFKDYNATITKYVTELKIKESDQNYFPNFRVAMLHPLELLNNVDRFENGLVVESVQIRNGERVYPTKLVHSENIKLELIVE